MCASAPKFLINQQTRQYVQAVFSERLREEGFINLEDRDIFWLRIKGEGIVNSVHFCSLWNKFPVILFAGQGIYPLFSDLYLPKNVCDKNNLEDERSLRQPITGLSSFGIFSPTVNVLAPTYGNQGLDVFTAKMLPTFNYVNTIEDSYVLAKRNYTKFKRPPSEMYAVISEVFIDQAIYVDDSEVYPYCRSRVEKKISWLTAAVERSPSCAKYRKELQLWQEMIPPLFDNARDEYLKTLEQRKQKNIALLQKKYGIIVP